MIIKTIAIPLTCHPYSSTSRIVHWLTRHHGKVSTLLKGAFRPRNPFLGEYELFSTSELLYFKTRTGTLHTGKECALLHPRPRFRNDWRAMQAASCITALFHQTTPEESPCPDLFELFEELLDFAEEYGHAPAFLFWAELRFCRHHGHAPQLECCTVCSSESSLRFGAAHGGMICNTCSVIQKLPTLPCPPDIQTLLRTWQQAKHPHSAAQTPLSIQQNAVLSTLSSAFMRHHFQIGEYRQTLR